MTSGGGSGPPMGFTQPAQMGAPSASAEIVVDKSMVPAAQKKYPTDIVSRQLTFWPSQVAAITSANANQLWSFWLPGGNLLDNRQNSLRLRGTFQCIAANKLSGNATNGYMPQPMPLPNYGNLIQQVALNINNERVCFKMNASMHVNLVHNLHRRDSSPNSFMLQDRGVMESPNGPRAFTADSAWLKGQMMAGPIANMAAPGFTQSSLAVGNNGQVSTIPFLGAQTSTVSATGAGAGATNFGVTTVLASAGVFTQFDVGRTMCLLAPGGAFRMSTMLGPGSTAATVNQTGIAGSNDNLMANQVGPRIFILGQVSGFTDATHVTITGQPGALFLGTTANFPITLGSQWQWQWADYLGLGYQLPRRGDEVPVDLIQQLAGTTASKGRDFSIDLAIFGELLYGDGLIPLNRLPRPRLDIVFNTAASVLYIPNTQSIVAANYVPQLGDYSITNLRINAMFAQSPSLVQAYNMGDWLPTFTGIDFFSVPVQAGQTQSIPIPMTYKSAKYILGFFCNPAQFTGANGIGTDKTYNAAGGTTPSATPYVVGPAADRWWTGVTTLNPPQFSPGLLDGGAQNWAAAVANLLFPQSDYTRTENFYGLGGSYGGCNNIEGYVDGVVDLRAASGAVPYVVAGGSNWYLQPQCTFPLIGNDKTVGSISNLFFNMNSENIYQQPLSDPNEFMDELLKVFPGMKDATWLNKSNFPGIRFVLCINLQTPEMQKFISGARSAIGQQMAFLNFNINNAVPISGCSFQGWIAYDRTIRVEAGGRTSSDW